MKTRQILCMSFLVVMICFLFVSVLQAQDQTQYRSGDSWEYLVIYEAGSVEGQAETLNKYGRDGWELVDIDENRFYLKRKKVLLSY